MSSRVKIPGIDRRYLYLLLFFVVSIPLLYPLRLPIPIGEHSKRFYDKVESLSAGNIVIVSFDYGPSTRPENYPQSVASLFHAKERGCKIVVLAYWPSGAPIGEEALRESTVFGSDFPNIPEYGTEVVYLGYVPGNEVGMQTFGDNTATAKGIDHYGNDVTSLPLIKSVKVLQISRFGLRLPLELLVSNKSYSSYRVGMAGRLQCQSSSEQQQSVFQE